MENSPAYDNGFRAGMFHKCNGIVENEFDTLDYSEYNFDYVTGYHDGFDTNERKI